LPDKEEKYELHRLLGTLLSDVLPAEEKLNIMETEYHIPTDDSIREDVNIMCNLSQGILERGEARGEARGETRGLATGLARGAAEAENKIIINMNKSGFTVEQIAMATDKSAEEVEAIIENGGSN
jgi:predicted transposase YdaD